MEFSNTFKKQTNSSDQQTLILEGKILIEEALKCEFVKINKIFFTKTTKLNLDLYRERLENDHRTKIIQVDEKLMSFLSNVENSQGIIALVNYQQKFKPGASKLPISVILDRVKDPGNVGTILRSAVAVGCQSIFVLKGCANIWSPKVLRSAMGAHFYIRIINDLKSIEELIDHLKANQMDCIVYADSNQSKNPICYSKIEEKLASNQGKKGICIVIGNETQGISEDVYKLGENGKFQKIVVKIPSKIESLNCSIAFAVIVYELRKLFSS